MPRFQVHAIAHDDDAVEGQPRLRAVPGDELVDGVLIDAARGWRAEAGEHCEFAMVQIRQSQYTATVVRLDSLHAHGDGLHTAAFGTARGRRRAPPVWAVGF